MIPTASGGGSRAKTWLVLALLLFPAGRALGAEAEQCPAEDAIHDAVSEPTPQPKPSIPKLVGGALWNEVRRYGADTAALVVAPFHWDAEDRWRAVGAAALIGGAFAADQEVDQAFQRNRSDFTDGVSGATSWFGDAEAVGLAVGLVAGGLLSGNHDIRDMGRDALEASIITGIFTNWIIKPAAGRWRPRESDGKTKFEPFSGRKSFSSGHATQAFAVASVIAMRSPGWVIPTVVYGLASVVAFDRINDRAHFASDVVAGALFATATGRFLVKRHRQEAAGLDSRPQPAARLEVVPIPDGVALRLRW